MSLTLEDGWTTLIDGLQVHRYYLQVQPARDRQLERCHELARRRPGGATLPPLPELVSRFGAGPLEHLLHPARPGGPEVPSHGTPPTSSAAAGGLAVVVDEAACLSAAGVPLVPVDAVAAGTSAWPDGTEKVIRAAFEQAGLSYLLTLCAEVVLLTPHGSASDAPGASGSPDTPGAAPWSTVLVSIGTSPLRQAALLADAAARQMLTCFARAADAGRGGGRLRSPVRGAERPVTEVAADIIGVAAEWRLLRAVVQGGGPRHGGGAGTGVPDWVGRRLTALDALLPECAAVLEPLQEGLAEPNTYDLVAGLLPGEHRFVRYREGGGLGQH
ncbi:hypothetical protein ABNF97_27580 [Plantactinospora sp. B6F1]|uniref:hypothetical protein n=1 Tax=Plantactinospora sp. B6F1 TaxID=3158971 RepID=UPI0032D95BE8